MKVAIWDTYVTKKDGSIMHFDIIVPAELKDEKQIHQFGRAYLDFKGQSKQSLTSNECKFCHIEFIKPKWKNEINQKGYYIYELENCN